MADNTKVEWADASWSPVTGCTPISEGCQNCYAKRMARRLAGRYGYPEQPNHFDVTLHGDRLEQPLKWKKPRAIFVCSMSDLFHEDIEWIDIADVWDVMSRAKQHIFMVLTKRPRRMNEFLWDFWLQSDYYCGSGSIPSNIWLGVTAENQKRADERIPLLLQIPATTKFVSIEPCLSPIDLCNISLDSWTRYNALEGCGVTSRGVGGQSYPNVHGNKLDWVVVGTETGPGARSMHLNWARRVRDQCVEFGTPFFYKRGETGRLLDGRLWEQYPISMVQRE